MKFSAVFVTTILATTTMALPLPHLPLGSVSNLYENVKRGIIDSGGLDFMSIAAKNGAQNTQEGNSNMMGGTGLCRGSDIACVAGPGQVTK